jgi:hypothetical protein
LIRLPHTGLRIPDDQLNVTPYKQLTTHDGVAFTANLKRGKNIVGTIENEGCGGETRFHSRYLRNDAVALTEQALADYAARCRTESGEPVTVEHLLDELVDEFEWTKKITRQHARGGAQLRLMGPNHEDRRFMSRFRYATAGVLMGLCI